MSPRDKLALILGALKDRIASPSDVISATGLPRYEVLAAFHIMEALKFVEVVYVRGNYKLYRLAEEGRRLLEVLSNGREFTLKVVEPGNDIQGLAQAPQQSGEASAAMA